jgi:hypothetical protein
VVKALECGQESSGFKLYLEHSSFKKILGLEIQRLVQHWLHNLPIMLALKKDQKILFFFYNVESQIEGASVLDSPIVQKY